MWQLADFWCGSWLIFDVAVGYGPIIQHLSPIPHFFVTIFCVMKKYNFQFSIFTSPFPPPSTSRLCRDRYGMTLIFQTIYRHHKKPKIFNIKFPWFSTIRATARRSVFNFPFSIFNSPPPSTSRLNYFSNFSFAIFGSSKALHCVR